MWGGAYVVRERSAVSSVVSMVMFAVLKLMVNVYCGGKSHPKKDVKRERELLSKGTREHCGKTVMIKQQP